MGHVRFWDEHPGCPSRLVTKQFRAKQKKQKQKQEKEKEKNKRGLGVKGCGLLGRVLCACQVS